jgi:peptidylprolyl isomerase
VISSMTFRILQAAASSVLFSSLTLMAQSTPPKSPATPHRTVTHRVVSSTGLAPLPKDVPPVKGPVKIQYVMRYQEIVVGQGELAKPGQFYKVNYTGWLASDGTKFDSSYDRGQPIEFLQGSRRVISGWDQGFEGMHVGGKRRLFIPYQLAYGEAGRGPIPPKADLIFDVELLGQRDPNAPAPEMQPANPQQPQ